MKRIIVFVLLTITIMNFSKSSLLCQSSKTTVIDKEIQADSININTQIQRKSVLYPAFGVFFGYPGLLYGTFGLHTDYFNLRLNIGLLNTVGFKTSYNFLRTKNTKHGVFFEAGTNYENESSSYAWYGIGYEFFFKSFYISPISVGYTNKYTNMDSQYETKIFHFDLISLFQIGFIVELK